MMAEKNGIEKKIKRTNLRTHRIYRAAGLLLGFVLFYAPFAVFQRGLIQALRLAGRSDIHGQCFRMAIKSVAWGQGLNILTTTGISFLLLSGTAFFFGPIFCGRLCAVGGVGELVSRLVPKPLRKFQVDLQKHLPVAPLRYGALAGYLLTPALGFSVMCSFCNFTILERLVTGGLAWDLGIMSSTFLLTLFVWVFGLGAFAKGGRGYCSYLCPVGAVQSVFHRVGSLLPLAFKIKISRETCLSCGACEKACPMGALRLEKKSLEYQQDNCIACADCIHVCPRKSLSYGCGKSGWKTGLETEIKFGTKASGAPA